MIGSYFGAEYVKVRRPRARGQEVARRGEAPPSQPAASDVPLLSLG